MEVINTFFASFSLIDNWESILAIAIVYLLPLLFIFVMSLEIDDLPSTVFIFHFLANLRLCVFVLPEHYYVENYLTAKEACLEVDRQVSKWIGYDIQ